MARGYTGPDTKSDVIIKIDEKDVRVPQSKVVDQNQYKGSSFDKYVPSISHIVAIIIKHTHMCHSFVLLNLNETFCRLTLRMVCLHVFILICICVQI